MINLSTEELQAELERRQQEQKEANKPKMITEGIDLAELVITCQEYIDNLFKGEYFDRDDYQHYIYEEALKALYGKDIFNWINKQ